MKPLLCVDFDGTITADCKVPLPGCIETLTRLRQSYRIGIFSARATQAERDQMVRLLTEFGVPYDEVLGVKPNAEFFIDDKGIHFNEAKGWNGVADEVAYRHTQ